MAAITGSMQNTAKPSEEIDPRIKFRTAIETRNVEAAALLIGPMLRSYEEYPEKAKNQLLILKRQVAWEAAKNSSKDPEILCNDPRWQEIQNVLQASTEGMRKENR